APLVILAGWIAGPFLSRKKNAIVIGLLFFMILFPLFWVMLNHSNLYDGFRHLLFIYPVVCALSGAAWSELIRKSRKQIVRPAVILLLAAGITGPFIFTIRNHPLEYTYFNQLAGGFNKAYGRYEIDYYYHSVGQAVQWLENEVLQTIPDSTVTVASNFPLEPYLLKHSFSGQTVYTGWYERTRVNWDYGIFVNNFISPYQLQHHNWPQVSALHKININGLPVCVVLKRENKQSLHCRDLYISKQFNEANRCYSQVVKNHPADEMSLLYLGWTYHYLSNYQASNRIAGRILALHPESEPARVLQATNLLYQDQVKRSLSAGLKALQLNPKYAPAQNIVRQAQDSLR
ncbi:MAG: hypothetical protein J7L89_01895, partial [Bacteroidales bacterium]|nr:hypothetical protein [Bacteroidales bacterium]